MFNVVCVFFNVLISLCGGMNMMSVVLLCVKFLNFFVFCEDFGGGKSINVNLFVGNFVFVIVVKIVFGFGMGNIFIFIVVVFVVKFVFGLFIVGIFASFISVSVASFVNRFSIDFFCFVLLCV